jgi:hypothetical protein
MMVPRYAPPHCGKKEDGERHAWNRGREGSEEEKGREERREREKWEGELVGDERMRE